MGTPTPAELVVALRDWGCDVAAYEPDGVPWYRHTTPGAWSPVGVVHHHTAGSSTLLTSESSIAAMLRLLRVGTASAAARQLDDDELSALVSEHLAAGFGSCHATDPTTRRAGIPGPLCHLAPAMVPGTGRARIHLIGWGNVNHAGMGSSRVLAEVRTGIYAGAAPGGDDTDGNPHFFGLEYLHPGNTTTAWPDALLEAGHRAGCAISEACGWAVPSWPGSQIEHRQWSARKIDRSWPGNVRTAVRSIAQEGKPMAQVDLTPAAVTAVAQAAAKAIAVLKVPNLDPATGEPLEGSGIAVQTVLSQLERWEDAERGVVPRALAAIQALASDLAVAKAEITALREALDAIASSTGGLTGEQIAAIVRDGAAAGAVEVLARISAAAQAG